MSVEKAKPPITLSGLVREKLGGTMHGDYKYAMQMMAEEQAEEEYGKDFYDLPSDIQDKVFTEASVRYSERLLDAADVARDVAKES